MQRLTIDLSQLPTNSRQLIIAFSGGIDSVVLAHHCLTLKTRFAISLWHVNHGLQSNADEMQQFAVQWAAQHELECKVDRVDLGKSLGKSLGNVEARARDARYRLFAQHLELGDVLLTAHHANDQAETFLLNLMRGSSSAGLRASAVSKQLGQGHLIRPMLELGRAQILHYAQQHHLQWIEDPSNASIRFDRNFLRHQVLPLLESRWPGAIHSFQQSIAWQRESDALLHELAAEDLVRCAARKPFSRLVAPEVQKVLALSDPRARNLIRHWLIEAGFRPPGHKKLEALLQQFKARIDAVPSVQADGYALKIFKGFVYCVEDVSIPEIQPCYEFEQASELEIKAAGFSVSRAVLLRRVGSEDVGQHVTIRFRQGQIEHSEYSHRLKRLFQHHAVPPWCRATVPQIFLDDELLGLWLPEPKLDHSEGS